MLDFCGKHNITADVEVIPIQKVNEAYERLLKSDVKYRFSHRHGFAEIRIDRGIQEKQDSKDGEAPRTLNRQPRLT